jgi:glycosyltransferase involved in cell wall biosynthesis
MMRSARYYNGVTASAQRADRIIAVSAATRDDIVQLLAQHTAKLAVIHSAADIAPAPAARAESDSPYVMFVGTFEPRKNLATALRALVLTDPALMLTIVGETGWGDAEPAAIARELDLSNRVKFAGRVSDAERDSLMRGARALLLPSLDEGFGLPVLEAMSRGTPVICSNVPALVEIGGSAALYHMPHDAAGLAELLNRVWHDPQLRRELSALGLQRAAEFSWERSAHETLLVYRQAAAS